MYISVCTSMFTLDGWCFQFVDKLLQTLCCCWWSTCTFHLECIFHPTHYKQWVDVVLLWCLKYSLVCVYYNSFFLKVMQVYKNLQRDQSGHHWVPQSTMDLLHEIHAQACGNGCIACESCFELNSQGQSWMYIYILLICVLQNIYQISAFPYLLRNAVTTSSACIS